MRKPAGLATIQAALRKITETLARDMGDSAPAGRPNPLAAAAARGLATSPRLPQQGLLWSDFEWRLARAVVCMQGVAGLLAGRLRWVADPPWGQFLAEQREHIRARHLRIMEFLQRIDLAARHEGIALVALKGAALHSMGLYRAGERPMADVDLLVRSEDAARTVALLEQLELRLTLTTWKHQVFEATGPRSIPLLGENRNNAMKVELHQRISEILPLRPLDITARVVPPDPVPGLNDYASPAALMQHLLLHAAGAMAYRALRLLHLHDIKLLAQRMTDADWAQVSNLSHGPGTAANWWAYPPLVLTAKYFDGIPLEVLAGLEAACPRALRRRCREWTLSDVSLSHLWIDAFPGIEWARSLGEVLDYARERTFPGRRIIELRRVLAPANAGAAGNEWCRLSQVRRIMWWLSSRPARIETMVAVHAALDIPF